jgi:precorrin-2/cobalt-factor-2 C20-methyltransferase
MTSAGTLFTIGMGPGDPELLTLKAVRILGAAPVVAYFAKRGRTGHARSIAGTHINPDAIELRFEYPFTTEISVEDPSYLKRISIFYEAAATAIAAHLDDNRNVALLCEGDPFFYGSAMYLFDRLGGSYRNEVIPGITGMSGCWTRAQLPFTHGDDVLTVLPGTLDEAGLTAALLRSDAAVIMKVGRNLAKIRRAVGAAGLAERAVYVERGTMQGERILKLNELTEAAAPYFSMVLIPGRQRPR